MLAFLSYTFEVHPMLGEKVACAAVSPYLYLLLYMEVQSYRPPWHCCQTTGISVLEGSHNMKIAAAETNPDIGLSTRCASVLTFWLNPTRFHIFRACTHAHVHTQTHTHTHTHTHNTHTGLPLASQHQTDISEVN